ncbi:hypothetical protein [Spirilliplanes yamanashiensis]|uniref:Uncharacterized protein n=1 Tax=Spirilliplanes yamanashiensis TaxID=42233 RepID=A0A8J3YCZ5_9ACTN|nr:hypothetical protein [Spirilliplanes yamanashiensis]MDP9819037.1 hypothetical protein [Spirilliplanes yamanashiensis]GIJ05492.1 hypothetical protein Sya03_48440 [Spirilliplanes yamanashiensis]
MPPTPAEVRRLLHALDDPDNLEFPASHHHRRARHAFGRLAQRLDADLGGRCRVDRDVQDASLHGRIEVPASVAATGRQLVISVSNFGGLAVLSVDNPGVWTDAEAAALLHPGDARRVEAALADLGYTLIPEDPLWERYDGSCDPRVFGGSAGTWWDRYFDYF